MNPEQAPWPINKLQEAKRNRDNLPKYSGGQRPLRADSPFAIPENQHQQEPSTVSDTVDIPYEYGEVLEESESLSKLPAANNFDNQTEFDKHSELDDPEFNADLENKQDLSQLLKSILVLGGIAALVIAGLLAYEHPMPKEEFQPEVPHAQNPLDVDNNETTEVTTVVDKPIDATPANEMTEKTHTADPLIEESKLDHMGSPTTGKLADSNQKPVSSNDSQRSEERELENVNINNNLPNDAQSEAQLIESQYESIDSPQLESVATTALVDNEADANNPNANTEQVSALLNRAVSLYNDLQLTIPPGENAFEIYHDVLEIDSDNADAINGIEQIKEKLLDLSELAIAEQNWPKARQHLDKIMSIEPDNSRALGLLETLNAE